MHISTCISRYPVLAARLKRTHCEDKHDAQIFSSTRFDGCFLSIVYIQRKSSLFLFFSLRIWAPQRAAIQFRSLPITTKGWLVTVTQVTLPPHNPTLLMTSQTQTVNTKWQRLRPPGFRDFQRPYHKTRDLTIKPTEYHTFKLYF